MDKNNFNFKNKKSLGQNFLNDKNIANKIVSFANINKDDDIIEIGCGLGILTKEILNKTPKSLSIIEIDSRLVKEISLIDNKKLKIFNEDALKFNFNKIVSNNKKIVANLPYNIATKLLINWLYEIRKYKCLVLMFQYEVALRIIAQPNSKHYGRLTIITDFLCDKKLLMKLKPNLFTPPPKVNSGVIYLQPKKNIQEKLLENLEIVVKTAFNQRRKMLKSSLKNLNINLENLEKETNINLKKRAENLSTEEFCTIAEFYQKNK